MNAMLVVIVGIIILIVGYIFYGGWLAKQWLSLIHIFCHSTFVAARSLRRASSLMRFCAVVRSHASCNILWHLRDQIYTASYQLILYGVQSLSLIHIW